MFAPINSHIIAITKEYIACHESHPQHRRLADPGRSCALIHAPSKEAFQVRLWRLSPLPKLFPVSHEAGVTL